MMEAVVARQRSSLRVPTYEKGRAVEEELAGLGIARAFIPLARPPCEETSHGHTRKKKTMVSTNDIEHALIKTTSCQRLSSVRIVYLALLYN